MITCCSESDGLLPFYDSYQPHDNDLTQSPLFVATIKKLKVMTTKSFNAKKMLMSTFAAVVFSFVFTTSANANSNGEAPQKSNLEIRVKDAPQKSNLEIRVKGAPNSFESFIEQVLGIRVRVRV